MALPWIEGRRRTDTGDGGTTIIIRQPSPRPSEKIPQRPTRSTTRIGQSINNRRVKKG